MKKNEIFKMSENSRTHYCGVPNKDEIQDNIGRFCTFIILPILFVVFLIAMCK